MQSLQTVKAQTSLYICLVSPELGPIKKSMDLSGCQIVQSTSWIHSLKVSLNQHLLRPPKNEFMFELIIYIPVNNFSVVLMNQDEAEEVS